MQTILIAEDDLIFLKFLTSVLHKFKDRFKFISASNGQDAIDYLKEKSISLVVTDIEMPLVDGLELLAYVKANHPTIPCIVMTAHKLDNTLVDDAVHLFPKPLDPEKMGQAIVEILERNIPTGSLYGISVVGLLEMVKMARKTCLCEVILQNKERGFLYFDNGVLYDVACGDLNKKEATIKLINAGRANFRFKYFSNKKIVKQVKMDLSSLFEEANRRKIGLTPKKFTEQH